MLCTYIYRRGPKRETQCTIQPKNGEFCHLHKRLGEINKTKQACEFMIVGGKYAGTQCRMDKYEDAHFCKKHTERTFHKVNTVQCKTILERGPNKGTRCLIKSIYGDKCNLHRRTVQHPLEKIQCKFIIKRGPKKGLRCTVRSQRGVYCFEHIKLKHKTTITDDNNDKEFIELLNKIEI